MIKKKRKNIVFKLKKRRKWYQTQKTNRRVKATTNPVLILSTNDKEDEINPARI